MKSFVEICKSMKDKLGRDLHEKEKDFLQWLCIRFEQEMEENER